MLTMICTWPCGCIAPPIRPRYSSLARGTFTFAPTQAARVAAAPAGDPGGGGPTTTTFAVTATDGPLTSTIGTISDEVLKENITDAPSTWDKFKAYRWVHYYLKDMPEAGKLLGLVAQEARQVSPGVVW